MKSIIKFGDIMNKEDINKFNELSRKICKELKPKDKCMKCPFYQWATYYSCFDYQSYEYPLNGDEFDE